MAFYPKHRKAFLKALESLGGKRVAVLGHKRPDGDCIGSQVALCRVLHAKGIEATVIHDDLVPRVLRSFIADTPSVVAGPHATTTSAGEEGGRLSSEGVTRAQDAIAVTVDCSDPKRVKESLLQRFPEILINIDHHISNPDYAAANIVVSEASSTGEILAGLFFDNDIHIDPITAQALYIAIATDTGNFRFSATNAQVFEICRRLCECGADPAAAAFELYENESFSKRKLLQHFLSTFELHCEGKVCIGRLEAGIYERTGASTADSEGLVDYARSIDGVAVGVLVEERNGGIKGSLRAKYPAFRVDRIAELFGGGGHAAAAGFNIEATHLDAFYPHLLKALQIHLASIDHPIDTSQRLC